MLVGFAMETDRDKAPGHVRDRIERKNLDLVVLNIIGEEGAGFGVDTTRVTLFRREGDPEELPLMSKREVAARIWQTVAPMVDARREDA